MTASRKIRVLVVIVNYRSAALTLASIRSLLPERGENLELKVLVVENQSGDEAALRAGLAEFEDVTLIVAERNGGFSYGNNIGFKFAYSIGWIPDYFQLLNPDTRVYPGAISALVDFMEAHPRAGIAGSRFENADGSEWPYAFRFPTLFSEVEAGLRLGVATRLLSSKMILQRMGDSPERVDWIPGASMLVRRELIEQLGGLDEEYFLYYEETDFCLKARRHGWECWHVPQSRMVHLAGQSTGVTSDDAALRPAPDYWFQSRSRYFKRNHGYVYAAVTNTATVAAYLLGNAKQRALGRGPSKPGFVKSLVKQATRDLLQKDVSEEKAFRPNGHASNGHAAAPQAHAGS